MRSLLIAASLFTAGAAAAQGDRPAEEPGTPRLGGRFAAGYVSTIAPFGLRWWWSDDWALDTGVGLYDDDTRTVFTYQGGVVYCLERSPQLLLQLRPGWSYRTQVRELAFGLTLMVEYFPLRTNKFSLTSGLGPHIKWTNLGRSSEEAVFESLASTLNVLGFHYYF